jgi:hypothetical protein
VKRSGSYSLEAIEQNSKILQKCMKSLAKDSFVKRDLELKESELASFVRNYENKEILEIPFSIVGKGEGLTPASDDFLCAFLILDRLSGRKKIVLDENWKKKVFQKTTRQSILQYLFAERGLSTLGFEELVKYFLQETVDVKKILHQVNVGHSSGSDMVFGLLSYPWF